MNKQEAEHIKDDFIKGLVGLTTEEKPSADFTDKVMSGIPIGVLVEEEDTSLKPWQWLVLAAALTGIVYFIVAFDLSPLFRQLTYVSEDAGENYLNMFTSMIQLFSNAFSGFQFTSISVMVILSGIALYLGDKFLRKRSSKQVVVI
jgi:hypothetical protein